MTDTCGQVQGARPVRVLVVDATPGVQEELDYFEIALEDRQVQGGHSAAVAEDASSVDVGPCFDQGPDRLQVDILDRHVQRGYVVAPQVAGQSVRPRAPLKQLTRHFLVTMTTGHV